MGVIENERVENVQGCMQAGALIDADAADGSDDGL